jgi:hypothetical protein
LFEIIKEEKKELLRKGKDEIDESFRMMDESSLVSKDDILI